MKRRNRFWPVFFSFAMGMGGNLHLPIPGLGFIAMLDLAAYVLAIPILLLKWNTLGKFLRRALLFAFLWTVAAMLANALNFVETRYWFKCVAVASSSWAIITCAYVILRNCPSGYLWYLVGAGLSGWISLYYFRNGALESFATDGGREAVGSATELLMDKQVYPHVARGIVLGCVLPMVIWFRKFPAIFIFVGFVIAGLWLLLHGGSRSSFGMYCAAAMGGALVLYGRRLYVVLTKNRIVLIVIGVLGLFLIFLCYKFMAQSGAMEEGEKEKFESQFGEGGEGAVTGRAGFDSAISDAAESWFIGKGWSLRNHSVMANALACEGVLGFAFWIYFYCQVLWLLSRRISDAGKYAVFILLMVLVATWDVFGSPFGTRHKFFVLMAFIALCRENPYYAIGAIFDEAMLGRRRMLWRG